jgi:predicted RNA-binding protein YlqC (UPF0109 family)
MKEFVEYIVKNLVDQPDSVDVRCLEKDHGTLVELRVDANDVAKVVGRRGRTINAVRTLVMMACARLGHRVRVELIECHHEAQAEEAAEELAPDALEEAVTETAAT